MYFFFFQRNRHELYEINKRHVLEVYVQNKMVLAKVGIGIAESRSYLRVKMGQLVPWHFAVLEIYDCWHVPDNISHITDGFVQICVCDGQAGKWEPIKQFVFFFILLNFHI